MSLEKRKHQVLFTNNPNPFIALYNESLSAPISPNRGKTSSKTFLNKKERGKLRDYMTRPNFSFQSPTMSKDLGYTVHPLNVAEEENVNKFDLKQFHYDNKEDMREIKAHQKSPQRITFQIRSSPRIDYSAKWKPAHMQVEMVKQARDESLRNKHEGTVTSFYVNPEEPKLIDSTYNTFNYASTRQSGSMGGQAAKLRQLTLQTDPYENQKHGFARTSNGFQDTDLKAILNEIKENAERVKFRDSNEIRYRYRPYNQTYINPSGLEKKGMFSTRQDIEAIKNATPAKQDPIHKTKNVWFIHDEHETVQDFVDSKIGFSPAKSMNALKKLDPIQSNRPPIGTIRSPQNLQTNLVDYVTHKKVMYPPVDSFYNTHTSMNVADRQLQQLLSQDEDQLKPESIFGSVNPNNTMTMGFAAPTQSFMEKRI